MVRSSASMRPLPHVEIVVETETLELGARGRITGRVWLQDGNVGLIGAWLRARASDASAH